MGLYPRDIVPISSIHIAQFAIRRALSFRWPVMVTGKPGVGKTTAFRALCDQHGFHYMEAGQSGNSILGLLRDLLAAYDIWTDRQYRYDLAKTLERGLTRRGGERPRLLVVDEYQTYSVTILRELLHFQEKLGIPLILCGNAERLAKTRPQEQFALAQIKSRVGPMIDFPSPSAEDCKAIGVSYNIEGMEAYEAVAHYGVRTSLRELSVLLDHAAAHADKSRGLRLADLETALIALHAANPERIKQARKLLIPAKPNAAASIRT